MKKMFYKQLKPKGGSEMETKEIAVQGGKDIIVNNSPADLIKSAIAGGADLEKMEKLLDLQIRWEANEAKKAYNLAMAKFKKIPIMIDQDKLVNYSTSKGTLNYTHASLGNVVSKITPELSNYGLSVSWKQKQDGGKISVACIVSHEMGHSEQTSLSAGEDHSGAKNDIQSIGSTVKYLQRYTLLSLLGLATQEDENDGKPPKATKPEPIKPSAKTETKNAEQKDFILKLHELLIKNFGEDETAYLQKLKEVTSFSDKDGKVLNAGVDSLRALESYSKKEPEKAQKWARNAYIKLKKEME